MRTFLVVVVLALLAAAAQSAKAGETLLLQSGDGRKGCPGCEELTRLKGELVAAQINKHQLCLNTVLQTTLKAAQCEELVGSCTQGEGDEDDTGGVLPPGIRRDLQTVDDLIPEIVDRVLAEVLCEFHSGIDCIGQFFKEILDGLGGGNEGACVRQMNREIDAAKAAHAARMLDCLNDQNVEYGKFYACALNCYATCVPVSQCPEARRLQDLGAASPEEGCQYMAGQAMKSADDAESDQSDAEHAEYAALGAASTAGFALLGVAGWKFHKGRREEHHLMRETELTDEVSDAPGPNEDV